jgi:uncharacterized protein (DUF1330 family)
MTKAYCIGHLKILNKERFMNDYAAHVHGTLQPYEGKIIVKGGEVSYREGEDLGQLDVVIEFPNRDSATNWMSSDSYKNIVNVRKENSTGTLIIIDGV